MEMINVEEAIEIINRHQVDYGVSSVPIEHATGYVLAESIHADRDFPPFDRVTMDGIAIHFDTWVKERNKLKIESVAPAGQVQYSLVNPLNCVEVMTGAILPLGCDTVIRYEDLSIDNGQAEIRLSEVVKGKNVHQQGGDGTKGDLLVASETKISGAEIGILATTGFSHVKVYSKPKILIVSTGNELVRIQDTPLDHQIRMSNSYQIASYLKDQGYKADLKHLTDDPKAMTVKLKAAIMDYDVLLLSGGVSKGKFDYVPEVLNTLGVIKKFHKVKQRPGKPFWFGFSEHCTVFALPGNPISSFVCTIRYVNPWLNKNMKLGRADQAYAILNEDVAFKPDLTFFLEVKLSISQKGELIASPQRGNGSGDLANAPKVDGYLELPQGKNVYKKGDVFKVFTFRKSLF